jgi:hypothetical protein
MRILFLFFVSIFFFHTVQAQAFKRGDVMISPGIGLGTYGVGYGVGFALPVVLNADFGVHKYISVGAYGGFWTRRWNYTSNDDYRFTSIHVGGRASFHFWQLIADNVSAGLLRDKLDIYVTPWLGYNIRSANWIDNNNGLGNSLDFDSRLQGGVQLGVRYFFNENIGIFGEFGGTPTSFSNLGVTFKF